MSQTSRPVTATDDPALPPGQVWQPIEGEELGIVLGGVSLSAAEQDALTRESLAILGRCTNPADPSRSRRAGLVLGGVQSGKTLSFTTVMALARDNGYHLVILVAGTKENLLEQSRDRLADDLRLDSGSAHYRWAHHKSPKPSDADSGRIAADLEHALERQAAGDDVPTVLITVMKNATHMSNAAAVLREVSQQIDMSRVCALVIDDEADQATPNLRPAGESATYRNLREIRDELPRHTLLEYTATPQAPLLAHIADEISPEFTVVLTPGHDYTGGEFFLLETGAMFLRIIPPADLACLTNPRLGPPDSLMRALAVFLVGAAAAQLQSPRPAQRSMLVHPSQATLPQAEFRTWIESAQRVWSAALEEEGDDARDLLERVFRPAYDDLAASVPDLAAWEDVIARLPTVMKRARIQEVNSRAGRAPMIEWSQAYAWILVGGALMDRGFTVEGLTVTYMPRGTGVGNADTLQQRARFFGYKRGYAGYCRAWLDADVANAFTGYVQHEEAMRRELQRVADSGEPLRSWRRRFLLDPGLRLTRQAASRIPTTRLTLDNRWFQQSHAPLPPASEDIAAQNQATFDALLNRHEFELDQAVSGHTAAERHDACELTLREAYEQLLVDYRMVDSDHPKFLGLLLSLDDYLHRTPSAECVIYRMSQGATRQRALQPGGSRIKNLMQGRTPDGRYRGDREVRDPSRISIQLHIIDVTGEQGQVLHAAVPFLAVWVPPGLGIGAAVVEA